MAPRDDEGPPALSDTEVDSGADTQADTALAPAATRVQASASPALVAQLVEGAMVGGRLRIIRLLGHGGMGEVYAADDQILGERVALKTIRRGSGLAERAMERFRREVQLARRVTHPNVCRIFDLGVDGQTMYLTMELLSGETLAARLARVGRLSPAEARPVIVDMAAALEAAHRAGVVHRDFKPGNVMLQPLTGDRDRVVVTDFGIARALGDAAELSGPGEMLGSPAYMAPEQVTGGAITPATDVFALGVVAYEMVTGHLPFEGDTPMAMAMRRVDAAPTPPRQHVAELDPRWEAWMLRCLARKPADRFAGAEAAMRALIDRRAAVPPPAIPARPGPWIAAALIACAAGVGLGIALNLGGSSTTSAPPAVAGARRSVAMIGFANRTGRSDLDWLSTALLVMLPTELAGDRLRVIPDENLDRLRAELGGGEAISLAPAALARVRRELAADYVVVGSYSISSAGAGGQLAVDLVVHDTATGRAVASLSETCSEAELRQLVTHLGVRLRAALRAPTTGGAQEAAIRAAQPSSAEAVRLYAEGLAHLRSHDPEAARQRLEAALADDPDQPLVRSALAQALDDLGLGDRAKQEALRAAERAASLPAEDRLLVEARAAEAMGRWEAAIDARRRLAARFHDDVEHGLRLASAQIRAARAGDALVTLSDLRRRFTGAADASRIDLEELRATYALGDNARALELADRTLNSGGAGGSPTTLAEATSLKASVLWSMGRSDQALAANQEARRRMTELGNRLGAAQVLGNEGLILSVRKSIRQAMDRFTEAAGIFRELGAKVSLGDMLGNVAFGELLLGEPVEARRVLVEARAVAGEISPAYAAYLELLEGWLAYEDGDLDDAAARLERALALARSTGSDPSDVLAVRADVLRARGDLPGAVRLIEQALAESEARHSQAGWHRVALARLTLDGDDAAAAEKRARDAIADCERLALFERVEEAHALHARALVGLGRLAEARRELAGLWERVRELRETRIQIARAWLELDRAAGASTRDDLARLQELLAEARRARHLPDELEIRLLLARDPEALGRDAAARGFSFVLDRLTSGSPPTGRAGHRPARRP